MTTSKRTSFMVTDEAYRTLKGFKRYYGTMATALTVAIKLLDLIHKAGRCPMCGAEVPDDNGAK